MRGKVAKRLRRQAYGYGSPRARTYKIEKKLKRIFIKGKEFLVEKFIRHNVGHRALYRQLKKQYKT